jgi:hypothetical protein
MDGREIGSAFLKEFFMKTSEEGQILRIFIGESGRWEGKPLYVSLRWHGVTKGNPIRF